MANKSNTSWKLTSAKATMLVGAMTTVGGITAAIITMPSAEKTISGKKDSLVFIPGEQKKSERVLSGGRPYLAQFTLNEKLSTYAVNTDGSLSEDMSYDVGKRSHNPIFDITFYNDSEKDIFFTGFRFKVNEFQAWQGDAVSPENSKILKVLNKYVLQLPSFNDDSHYVGENYDFVPFSFEKAAIPAVMLPPKSPARIQLELVTGNDAIGNTDITIGLILSDGTILEKRVDIIL